MLVIGICDDDIRFLNDLSRRVKAILERIGCETKIVSTTSPSDLMSIIDACEQPVMDLVILDLEMPKMHGYHLASRIHAVNPNISVIFVTSHNEKILDSFHYGAIGFIPKQQLDERLKLELLNAMEGIIKNQQMNSIAIDTLMSVDSKDRREVQNSIFSISEITYIEAVSRDIVIHLIKSQVIAKVNSFSELSSKLEKYGFIRIYRSITINPQKIRSIHKNYVILESGTQLPISRSIRRDLHEIIINRLTVEKD